MFPRCQGTKTESIETSPADTIAVEEPATPSSFAVYNSISNDQGSAPSIYAICSMAERVIRLKDSLEIIRGTQELTEPGDSLILAPVETKAYDAILFYKKILLSGVQLPGPVPGIVSEEPVTDKLALKLLPKIDSSQLLADKKFFFLGGGSFLNRIQPEEGMDAFSSTEGKPEIRYFCNVNENVNHIFDAVLHLRKSKINVLFGPPLSSYEMGPQEVKGIGSVIHEFADRFPVLFITKNGMVPAQLVSVSHKLVPEYLGCVSDQPAAVFAVPSFIGEEILGVFIPYRNFNASQCTVNQNGRLWTADLNGDGIPDLAGVTDMFSGIASDEMVKTSWYVNIHGEWKMIDSAEELDCT
jgi:hypothetical protein